MSEVTTRKAPTLVDSLPAMTAEIQRVLPKHMEGDRIARIVLTELRKNPNLAQSTPQSFFGALLTASALGLEPGVSGECYLVPYRDKKRGTVDCQLIVGYQGVAKLFWQHPLAAGLDSAAVYENDHFVFTKGLTERLEHKPAVENRGRILGYYAIARLSTGAAAFDYFTVDQIAALRGGKVGTSGDIADPEHWMERKTALKQVLKLMPKSVELTQAVTVDETVGSMSVGRAIASGDGLPRLEHADGEGVAIEAMDADQPEQGTLA